ncbi:MAG: PD40 domain-containing protein, partial [Deinococcus sp.]|nr:PD40 domain-containing protein [Deinococcus sp.]
TLTPASAMLVQPQVRWRPDDDQLSVISLGGELLLIDPATRTTSALPLMVTDLVAIDWSPDGTHLAGVGTFDGVQRLFVFDLASAMLAPLVSGDGEPAQPRWSPDGQALFFTAQDSAGTRVRRLALGPELTTAARTTVPSPVPLPPQWGRLRVELRDGRQLRAEFVTAELTLQSTFGALTVPTAEVIRLRPMPEGVEVTLLNGDRLSGQVAGEALMLRLGTDTVITLDPADLTNLTRVDVTSPGGGN